ncbi:MULTISPECIES: NADP-dependent oxidoreductase [Streptomyces]|uniref:NADP-dependent oxidoreductase n=1 Tax=Streptomyces griseoaurantiacus TaxID=68213 RepID=A0ABZ1UVH8_9ACTN|nr:MULTISPECIES: NADP-dependent oxidoreductase [Streptomyces]MCF0086492.1 2-haloacrylate reductase [Streptomyces sp. MH192]MCF0098110.1 2-haloacrylate reductase [Streptomyces sp. MH191]
MRAVGFTEFGGPEVLGVHDLPDPHPGAGEVRIRVRAAAVNPTDVASRTGLLGVGTSRPPYIPGAEAAGVIDEVGAGSTWRIGEEVMTMAVPMSGHGGAYAEYLLAPDDSLARVPAGTSPEQAATLPMNGLTALQILELMSLSPGERLVVTGGAGVVGSLLVQLARRRGLTVIADAAPKDFPLLRSLGADHVLERGDDLAARIRAVLGDGVDAVADTALLHEKVVPALRDGGVFVSLRRWRGEPERGIRHEAAWVPDEYRSPEKLDALREAVEDGDLVLREADALPAEEAARAHRLLEAGGLRRRIVLTF